MRSDVHREIYLFIYKLHFFTQNVHMTHKVTCSAPSSAYLHVQVRLPDDIDEISCHIRREVYDLDGIYNIIKYFLIYDNLQ